MTLQTEPSSAQMMVTSEVRSSSHSYTMLLAPLREAKHTLQLFSAAYPSSGLDAWTLGYRLSALVDTMLQWHTWLQQFEHPNQMTNSTSIQLIEGPSCSDTDGSLEPMWTQLEAAWTAFRTQLPVEHALADEQYAAYPLQLRAYCMRHRTLMLPVLEQYDENDMEFEAIIRPAIWLHQSIEAQWIQLAQRDDTPAPSPLWKNWKIWAVVLALFLGYTIYQNHTQPLPTSPMVGLPKGSLPGGILGAYYNGTRFQTLKQKRIDSSIWFHWQHSPASGVNANQFSVRWSGYVHAQKKGTYTFCIQFDDGAYVYVGTRTLLSHWRKKSNQQQCRGTTLTPGWHRLIVQMNEQRDGATAKLSWKPPGAKIPHKIESKFLCCRNR